MSLRDDPALQLPFDLEPDPRVQGPRFQNASPESAVASRWKGSGPTALQLIRRTQITGNLPQFKCYITVTNYCASRENSSRKINNGRLSIHLETSCLNYCFQCFQSGRCSLFSPWFYYAWFSVKCVISVPLVLILWLFFTGVCMRCQSLFISCFISTPCHWAYERVVHFLLSLLSILSILSILSLHLSTPFQYFSPALLGIFSSFSR